MQLPKAMPKIQPTARFARLRHGVCYMYGAHTAASGYRKGGSHHSHAERAEGGTVDVRNNLILDV